MRHHVHPDRFDLTTCLVLAGVHCEEHVVVLYVAVVVVACSLDETLHLVDCEDRYRLVDVVSIFIGWIVKSADFSVGAQEQVVDHGRDLLLVVRLRLGEKEDLRSRQEEKDDVDHELPWEEAVSDVLIDRPEYQVVFEIALLRWFDHCLHQFTVI